MGKLLKKVKANRAKQVANKYEHKKRLFNKALSDKILQTKGQRFTGFFYCNLCGNKHSGGYVYDINGVEYEICKYCYNRIFEKLNYVKIVYTPMGNNQ